MFTQTVGENREITPHVARCVCKISFSNLQISSRHLYSSLLLHSFDSAPGKKKKKTVGEFSQPFSLFPVWVTVCDFNRRRGEQWVVSAINDPSSTNNVHPVERPKNEVQWLRLKCSLMTPIKSQLMISHSLPRTAAPAQYCPFSQSRYRQDKQLSLFCLSLPFSNRPSRQCGSILSKKIIRGRRRAPPLSPPRLFVFLTAGCRNQHPFSFYKSIFYQTLL